MKIKKKAAAMAAVFSAAMNFSACLNMNSEVYGPPIDEDEWVYDETDTEIVNNDVTSQNVTGQSSDITEKTAYEGSYDSFGTDMFSANISDYFQVTGEIPEGYTEKTLDGIKVCVPSEGSTVMTDSTLLWQSGGMTFRLTGLAAAGISEDTECVNGTFGGNPCVLFIDGNNMRLDLQDSCGSVYTAVFEGSDSIAAAKIFGSIHMDKPLEYIPPIQIDSVPSPYGDENYGMAESEYLSTSVFLANAPAVIAARFQVNDTSREYETDFDCYIERLEPDGKWYRVIPLSEIVQACHGYSHFYSKDEAGRIPVCLDLACYPLLPSGKYRLVKPFREKGADSDEYAALFDFTMSAEAKPLEDLLCRAQCREKTVSKDAESITCDITASKLFFAMSEIVDIETETSEGWKSVRKTPVHTNTLHSGFPMAFAGAYSIDTSDFDISQSGNYRVRFSYGSCDEDLHVPYNGYDTAYAYFNVI